MDISMRSDHVPPRGPLQPGAIYRRSELHTRFGGNRFTGIVPSKQENVVLLFHTKEPAQQFYEDGYDCDGIFWYSGEGMSGEMEWTFANRSIRDHFDAGCELLLFERAQRKGGYWRFIDFMNCIHHKAEARVDKNGESRKAIIFGLLPLGIAKAVTEPAKIDRESDDLVSLRRKAQGTPRSNTTPTKALVNFYARARSVRRYVLARASGVCEACEAPAPFNSTTGPFLEIHHLTRLADGGPDLPERVAAICPNCHRRSHYSIDAQDYNQMIHQKVQAKEESLAARCKE